MLYHSIPRAVLYADNLFARGGEAADLRITTTHQAVVVRGSGSKITVPHFAIISRCCAGAPNQKLAFEGIGVVESPVRIGASEITWVQIVDRTGKVPAVAHLQHARNTPDRFSHSVGEHRLTGRCLNRKIADLG